MLPSRWRSFASPLSLHSSSSTSRVIRTMAQPLSYSAALSGNNSSREHSSGTQRDKAQTTDGRKHEDNPNGQAHRSNQPPRASKQDKSGNSFRWHVQDAPRVTPYPRRSPHSSASPSSQHTQKQQDGAETDHKATASSEGAYTAAQYKRKTAHQTNTGIEDEDH